MTLPSCKIVDLKSGTAKFWTHVLQPNLCVVRMDRLKLVYSQGCIIGFKFEGMDFFLLATPAFSDYWEEPVSSHISFLHQYKPHCVEFPEFCDAFNIGLDKLKSQGLSIIDSVPEYGEPFGEPEEEIIC